VPTKWKEACIRPIIKKCKGKANRKLPTH
jgi:hypothetical protein